MRSKLIAAAILYTGIVPLGEASANWFADCYRLDSRLFCHLAGANGVVLDARRQTTDTRQVLDLFRSSGGTGPFGNFWKSSYSGGSWELREINLSSGNFFIRGAKLFGLPPPSCRYGSQIEFKYPSTDRCFNFEYAEPGAEFESDGYIYKWDPQITVAIQDYMQEARRLGMARPSMTPEQLDLQHKQQAADQAREDQRKEADVKMAKAEEALQKKQKEKADRAMKAAEAYVAAKKLKAAAQRNNGVEIVFKDCIHLDGIVPDGNSSFCHSVWSNSCAVDFSGSVYLDTNAGEVNGIFVGLKACAENVHGEQFYCSSMQNARIGRMNVPFPVHADSNAVARCR